MYLRILIYGSVLWLCACGENQVNKDQTSEIVGSTQTETDNRESPNANGVNDPLSLPGVPASIFDIDYYQHINETDPEVNIKQDFLRGGLLYDTWWTFLNGSIGEAPPITNALHPAWPTAINATMDPGASWRCVTCHGWDYIGVEGVNSDPNNPNFSGIGGIIRASPTSPVIMTDPALIYEFLHSGQTAMGAAHEFGIYIEDPDLYALTRFISTVQGQAADLTRNLSPFSIIDLASKTVIADPGKGYVQYHNLIENGGCDENCHGKDGQLLELGSIQGNDLSTMAGNDPWQVLHKIRFGQPGSIPFMPAMSPSNDESNNFEIAANTLSYVQVGLIRDYVRGGRLYDNFFIETGSALPAEYNHLWDQRDFSYDAPLEIEDSWTCSGCHGYDYFGQVGFDNNLLYLRDRPWTEDYLFERLSEGFSVRSWPDPVVVTAHDYKGFLSENDRWDLTAFLMNGLVDTYRYIYTTWSSTGNVDVGRQLYATPYGPEDSCLKCHGIDGVGGGVMDNPVVDIFAFSWDTPWEFLHKVRFGVAGTIMPALEQNLILSKEELAVDAAADIQRYTQQRIDVSTPP